jgi:ribosomal protein S18 acetylase RimI-like enzyme
VTLKQRTTLFRHAEPKDIGVLLATMRQHYTSDEVPFDEERSRRATLQLMKEPAQDSCASSKPRLRLRYVVFTIGYSLEFGGWHGFIDELFVAALYRGAGIGTAAVRHVEEECVRRGMTALLLEADLKNEKATALHHRLGFREHSRRLMMLRVGSK